MLNFIKVLFNSIAKRKILLYNVIVEDLTFGKILPKNDDK